MRDGLRFFTAPAQINPGTRLVDLKMLPPIDVSTLRIARRTISSPVRLE